AARVSVRRPDAYVDSGADRRVLRGVVGLRHLSPRARAPRAAAGAGGAAGLRARSRLHVGAAHPGAPAAQHLHAETHNRAPRPPPRPPSNVRALRLFSTPAPTPPPTPAPRPRRGPARAPTPAPPVS